jgi:hypothetical protein
VKLNQLLVLLIATVVLSRFTDASEIKRNLVAPNYLEAIKNRKLKLNKLKREFIPQLSKTTVDNRYSTAVFGMLKESLNHTIIDIPYEKIDLESSYFNSGKMPVQLHISRKKLYKGLFASKKNKRSKVRKAPLAIIINPMYSGDYINQMTRFIEFFGKKGFHVLVFFNTWSLDMMNENPRFMPGNMYVEAEAHLKAVHNVIDNYIGKDNVSGATLIGASYGSFLAPVLKNYDQRSRKKPLINGPTISFNPPFDIFNSLANLDHQAEEALIHEEKCVQKGGLVKVFWEIFTKDYYKDTDLDEDCTKFFLSRIGFKMTLELTLESINKAKNLGYEPEELKKISYMDYINDFSDINIKKPGQTHIGYWMAATKKRGYNDFLIVTSRDDSINDGLSLFDYPSYYFGKHNTIMLPTGGHTGLRLGRSRNKKCGKDWLDCYLNHIFP